MTVTAFVQGLIAKAKSQKLEQAISHHERYKELLRSINAGKQPPVEEIDAVLEGTSKKYEDLAGDAERLAERASQRAIYDTLGAHQANLDKYQRQVDALAAERNEYLNQMAEKIAAAQQSLRVAEQGVISAEAARDRLIQTNDDPTIQTRQAELEAERREFSPVYRAAESEALEARKKLEYLMRVVAGLKDRLKASDDASSLTALLDGPAAQKVRKALRDAEEDLERFRPAQVRAQAKYEELRHRFDNWTRAIESLNDRKLLA